jgi:hypothetical protein
MGRPFKAWSENLMMARRAKKRTKVGQKVQDYVAVAFARDETEAREYEALLASDNIPATIKQQVDADTDSEGYAVMVPEEFVDEAYVIIESQDAYDDFYDSTVDEEEPDLDTDVFDDGY